MATKMPPVTAHEREVEQTQPSAEDDIEDEIEDFMLDATWSCLEIKSHINPRFRVLFPAFEALDSIYHQNSQQNGRQQISFAQGLTDVLRAPTPPKLSFLLSLPGQLPDQGLWGIYAVVLRKASVFKLYIAQGRFFKESLR